MAKSFKNNNNDDGVSDNKNSRRNNFDRMW